MKKHIKQILMCIAIILIVSGTILSREIADLDEIWNYNTARVISEGKIPYKHVSMITTPLLPAINAIFLKMFSNSLLTMRILAIILISGILFMIYFILNNLKVQKSISMLATISIGYLLQKYFCIDYNFFVLFLTLIIIYLEIKNINNTQIDVNSKIKNKKQQLKHNLLIGIVAGLCITTKQTTGILISIMVIFYEIIFLLCNKKDNKKIDSTKNKYIANIIIKITGIMIPITILLIYLVINNALYDFIDYCILGIKTFSNKIAYSNLLKSEFIAIKILSICIPISIIIMAIYAFIKKNNKLLIIVFLSCAEFIVAFPISDNIHFLIGSIPTLIGIVYFINLIEKEIRIPKKQRLFFKFFFEYLTNISIILVSICGLYKNYINFTSSNNYSTLEHFKYIPINEGLEQTIKIVDEYIQNSEKNVYILNFDSALYMIPINKYNKNYDMFLKGNIGSKGEKGQIEKIKSEDAKYLIVKEGISRNWQNPEYVREYIKSNMNKTGEIESFDIYEN